MSTSIVGKIERIRGETGLSQVEFAEKIGISINTYKSLLKRNGAPRFELIESIARIWPQYSLWLLTDVVEPENGQLKPSAVGDAGTTHRFNIVDSVDARFMDKCAIKSDALKQLVFVQNAGNANDLAALITVDNGTLYQLSDNPQASGCIWVSPGNINLSSEGGGRKALSVFRDWLLKANSDLIADAEIWELKEEFFEDVYRVLKIPASSLEPLTNEFHESRFNSWKAGDGY